MDDARLLRLLGVAAEAIEEALMLLSPSDRERRGDGHDDQFEFDVLADRTAVDVLVAGGVGVLSGIGRSERSGGYWIPSTDRPPAAEASIRTGRASVRSTAMVPEPGWSSTLPRVVDTRPYGE